MLVRIKDEYIEGIFDNNCDKNAIISKNELHCKQQTNNKTSKGMMHHPDLM